MALRLSGFQPDGQGGISTQGDALRYCSKAFSLRALLPTRRNPETLPNRVLPAQ
ncbi:MAG: hypothetical protein LBT78_09195 [Tannerella sp.]|nr:hypothetical protein [Tannerella sp.]